MRQSRKRAQSVASEEARELVEQARADADEFVFRSPQDLSELESTGVAGGGRQVGA